MARNKFRLERRLGIVRERCLATAIKAALECQSHFGPMKVAVETAEYYTIGSEALVCCTVCIDRMYEALSLVKHAHSWSHYPKPSKFSEVIQS